MASRPANSLNNTLWQYIKQTRHPNEKIKVHNKQNASDSNSWIDFKIKSTHEKSDEIQKGGIVGATTLNDQYSGNANTEMENF